VTNLPQLHEAMKRDDVATLRRIAHHARGSLGLLGVPNLKELSEAIEDRYNELDVKHWRQCCQRLYEILEHLRRELEVRLVA